VKSAAKDMQKVIKANGFPLFKKREEKQEPVVQQVQIEGEGKVAKVGIKRENGYLYYIDSDGDISRSRMKKWHEKNE
jgi:hypothetical protein